MSDKKQVASNNANGLSLTPLHGKIKVALSLVSLCESLVLTCHSSDRTQMRQHAEAFLTEALTSSPFVSRSQEAAQAQEKMVRDFAPALLDFIHNPDPDHMLADLRKMAETLPKQFEQIHLSGGVTPDDPALLIFAQLMEKTTPEQKIGRKTFWQQWFKRGHSQ